MREYKSYEEYQQAQAEDAERAMQESTDAAAIAELQAQEQAELEADKVKCQLSEGEAGKWAIRQTVRKE